LVTERDVNKDNIDTENYTILMDSSPTIRMPVHPVKNTQK